MFSLMALLCNMARRKVCRKDSFLLCRDAQAPKKSLLLTFSVSKGVSFCKSLFGKSEGAHEEYFAGGIVPYGKGEGL